MGGARLSGNSGVRVDRAKPMSGGMMDWFANLTGFSETDYRSSQSKLAVKGDRLQSVINGASYAIGDLQIVSLESLRQAASAGGGPSGRLRVRIVVAFRISSY